MKFYLLQFMKYEIDFRKKNYTLPDRLFLYSTPTPTVLDSQSYPFLKHQPAFLVTRINTWIPKNLMENHDSIFSEKINGRF